MSSNTSANELANREAALIQKIREKGGHAGNITLQRELKWSDDQYWPIRDRLVDAGVLQLAKGKGGSVSIVTQESTALVPHQSAAGDTDQSMVSEAMLYEPAAEVLRKEWARDFEVT